MIRKVFGVDINDIDMSSAINIFLGNQGGVESGFNYVVTPNVDHFQRLESDPNSLFFKSYVKAKFVFCDSRIIQKFASLKGFRIDNVVTGSDLTFSLLSDIKIKMKKIMMVGPSEDDVLKIALKFNLLNVYSHTPPMGFIRNELALQGAIDAVVNSAADFVFLAVGSPQQEVLALRIKEYFEANPCEKKMVAFCIGASLDFLTEKQKRAPKIIQNLHLEWLHRALTNPRKLVPRYYRNFRWLCRTLFTGK